MKYVGAGGLDMGGTKVTDLGAPTAESDASRADNVSGIYTYNGSIWVLDPTSKLYQRFTGDPAPTTASGDIVLEQ